MAGGCLPCREPSSELVYRGHALPAGAEQAVLETTDPILPGAEHPGCGAAGKALCWVYKKNREGTFDFANVSLPFVN